MEISASLSEEQLNQIYNWVDEVPLSRPKKNIARDFADGVLIAEIIAHYIPKIVEVHNYISANSTSQKLHNWNTLNLKVFKKLGFQLSKRDIENVIGCQPEAAEKVLNVIQIRIDKYFERMKYGDGNRMLGENDYNKQEEYNNNGMKSQPNQLKKSSDFPLLQSNDQNIILEKDEAIQEFKETIEILELKIKKLEQLVKLKDSKIQTLQNKLMQNGIN